MVSRNTPSASPGAARAAGKQEERPWSSISLAENTSGGTSNGIQREDDNSDDDDEEEQKAESRGMAMASDTPDRAEGIGDALPTAVVGMVDADANGRIEDGEGVGGCGEGGKEGIDDTPACFGSVQGVVTALGLCMVARLVVVVVVVVVRVGSGGEGTDDRHARGVCRGWQERWEATSMPPKKPRVRDVGRGRGVVRTADIPILALPSSSFPLSSSSSELSCRLSNPISSRSFFPIFRFFFVFPSPPPPSCSPRSTAEEAVQSGGGRVRRTCVVGSGEGSGFSRAVGVGSEGEEGKKNCAVAAVRGVGRATTGEKKGGGVLVSASVVVVEAFLPSTFFSMVKKYDFSPSLS